MSVIISLQIAFAFKSTTVNETVSVWTQIDGIHDFLFDMHNAHAIK